MATQTISTADPLLKDLYIGPVIEQLNQKTYMLEQIKRDSDSIDHTGRRAIIPLHTGRNTGRGSIADNSTLPLPGKQTWQDAIVYIKYHYHGMEITDPAIEAASGNEGSFLNLLEAETKGVANDMKKDINRQIYGDGTGLLASVRANSTSTTVNVDQGVQYIQVGDPVDVLLKSNGTVNGVGVAGTTVTARSASSATPTITIADALAGTATTSYGVYISGSYGNEMDGLRNITGSSRTLHGVNSATAGNEFWNGHSVTLSDATATEDAFIQLADKIGAGGNGDVDVFITTRGIKRRLANTYQSQKRFNDAQAVKIHGGYTAIMVNEIPVVHDDDAPKKHIFALDRDAFRWFQTTDPGWLEQKDGSVFHLKDASTAGRKMNVWQAWLRWYAALGSVAPQRTGRITDAADDNAT